MANLRDPKAAPVLGPLSGSYQVTGNASVRIIIHKNHS